MVPLCEVIRPHKGATILAKGNKICRVNLRIRKTVLATGAVIVATVLTSCIRVDMDIVLEDGKASGEAVLAVSQELMEMAGDEASGELFEETDVPEGATVEPYEEDGYVGQRYVFEGTDLSEFDDEDFAITYDEEAGRYEVDGAMDFGSEDDLSGMPAGLADSFDVSLSVTFPGEVIEHNGELDGQTVTWTPSAGEVAEIHAVAEEGGGSGGSTWLWVAIAAIVVLIAAGLAYFFYGRRPGQANNPQPEGDPQAAAPAGDA